MNHLKAILTKFVVITLVLLIVLTLIFDVPFMDTLWISIVTTLLAYLLGDLGIFNMAGRPGEFTKRNGLAAVADLLLSFLTIWLMARALTGNNDDMFWPAALSALAITGGEWLFFHKFVDRAVFNRTGKDEVSHTRP
ncbi:DUF2512 family protein [Macrococcus lamae]|uniref:DUF2512 family protein n=1 Tax=Macrococcus lamae TaxID=198484 RepID=A0A4R6BU48_9STAP|nr:DUF2512 family protein [Macrococcus lamae]TDM10633.1 DUF2512 family protein [Macrococcus lamae]